MNIRRSEERGKTNMGWLDSRHSFSFGEYFDSEQMGFRSLRVINEDRVAPGKGFPTHPHRSMEILSFVIQGSLAHKDDMGNERCIDTGHFQYMSAGDGVRHSEYNPSDVEPVHFLQIWIEPREKGGAPQYADFKTDTATDAQSSQLLLLASPDGVDGSAEIRQDAQVYYGEILAGDEMELPEDSRFGYIWIQLISGQISLNGQILHSGDGVAIECDSLNLNSTLRSKFLLFRLS
ncbi:MAG: pirin family protein [Verrucomicrobiota bacterium]